jgi:cell division transport system permease protein
MVARCFKWTLEDIRSDRFVHAVTLITIALTIMIVSAAVLFFINVGDWMAAWQKGTRIMAYLRPGTGAAAAALQQSIESIPGVQRTVFLPRDEALRDLKSRMEKEVSLFENLLENPLPDAFEIEVTPAEEGWKQFEAVAARVRALPAVEEVEYGRQWVQAARQVAGFFQRTGLALMALLLVAAIAIVANTTRLVLHSRREEVEIMRLVGATERFIKAPFYFGGMLQGLIAAAVGLGVLYAVFSALATLIEQSGLAGMIPMRFLGLEHMGAIAAASMLVGWLGCYVSLKQELKS